MKRTTLIIVYLFTSVFCVSQAKSKETVVAKHPIAPTTKAISSDCRKAIPILLNNNVIYGPTLSPNGFGDEQEFKTNYSCTFEGEHNSAWYLLSVAKDGELVFDIIPRDTTNDYDFLLYAYTDSTFCDQFKKSNLEPVRGNLSNIKKSIKGVTGLKPNTLKNSVGEGVGVAFSKSIDVKKGEKYMLILDNVTPEGQGHTIRFYFMKSVEINGTVINSDSIPVVADIILSDNQGNTVEETKSNKSGAYTIKTSRP